MTLGLLNVLTERGVKIRLDGDRLGCRAAYGEVSRDIQELVREHKQELIAYLRESNGEWQSESLKLDEAVPDAELTVSGTQLYAKPKPLLTDNDQEMIRNHKGRILSILDDSPDHSRQERMSLSAGGSLVKAVPGAEPWKENELLNLLAIARRAGFKFEVLRNELVVNGPSGPVELRRLVREQAVGLAGVL
ncbi:MAG: hypothetical protein NT013_17165 [Planctomycetia bacterium]|nr:hypothetical protein [Planctomycetia bacterium]